MGAAAIQISSEELFGEPMHQDGECGVIRPIDNTFKKYRERAQINSKCLGLGPSSLQSLIKLG